MPVRPRNPFGFVRKHPDTSTLRWQGVVKYWDTTDERWRQRSKTFARKAEAQAWVDAALGEHRSATAYRPPTNQTLAAYLQHWLDDAVEGRRRASTADRYRLAVRHIVQRLGSVPLSQLIAQDV